MKSNILKAILLMFCFSTLMTYGQNNLFVNEKSDKEDIKRFMQHPSLQENFFQNNENEFFTKEHPFLNTKTKPTTKQANTNKANKQCLDSVVFTSEFGMVKHIFEYDTKGNIILYIQEYCVDSLFLKEEYTYDNNNNLILHIYYRSWETNDNSWQLRQKYEHAYDNNNNLILKIHYGWDYEINNWNDRYKIEYAYDNNNNLTLGIYYEWNNETNNWKVLDKTERTYDNNNNLILWITYEWNNETNSWKERGKYENAFDNNNNRILYIKYGWNDETNNWRESVKYENTYDINNNRILYINYGWDDETNNWNDRHKTEYAYDNNNNLTLEIWYERDYEFNNWIVSKKTEYAYDNNGNRTLEAHYSWNGNISSKAEWEYDLSHSITDLIHPPFFEWTETLLWIENVLRIEPIFNMPKEKRIYLYDGQPFGEIKSTCYWSNKEIGISETTKDNSSIKVYPNPTTGELTIDASAGSATGGQLTIENVEIFDIYGRKQKIIINYQLSIINSINISHFPTGIYFVKISTEAGEIVRKIIKE